MLHLFMLLLHLLMLTIIIGFTFGLNQSQMPKKRKYHFVGHLENLPSQKIYLNINHLEEGLYELQIIHKNKIVKKTTFKK